MRSGYIALKRRHTAGDAGYWPTPEKRRTPAEPTPEEERWRRGDEGDKRETVGGGGATSSLEVRCGRLPFFSFSFFPPSRPPPPAWLPALLFM